MELTYTNGIKILKVIASWNKSKSISTFLNSKTNEK
jgi:hypothetical protein